MRVGTDIIEIDRILKASETDNFVKKTFTSNEVEYAKKYSNYAEHLAGFFATKESFVKACGFGINSEIEILHNESGAPIINLLGKTKIEFEKKYTDHIVSISHCKSYATSVVIVS